MSSREQPEPTLEGLGQRVNGAQAPRNYTLDPEPGLRSGQLWEQAVRVVFKFYLQLSDIYWVLGPGIAPPPLLREELQTGSNPKSNQETGAHSPNSSKQADHG